MIKGVIILYLIIIIPIQFIHFIIIIIIVRTRFVTTRNSVGFVRKKAQTISFVERGFERLDLGHQTVGFSRYTYMVKSFSP